MKLSFGWTLLLLTLAIGGYGQTETVRPALNGDSAIEELKKQGHYGSLVDAVRAAKMSSSGKGSSAQPDDAIGQTTKLTPGNAGAFSRFGFSVALSGDTAVVGASAETVPGGLGQGAVHVFVRNGTVWSEQALLSAADGQEADLFGSSVAVSGDTVVVGAPLSDPMGESAQGSVYVFVRSGAAWSFQQKLVAADGGFGDQLGESVGISNETIVAGAHGDESAYVYVRSGTVWSLQQKLTIGVSNSHFGFSVAISGDSVVVGAYAESELPLTEVGTAYVFMRTGSSWSQQQRLLPSNGASNDNFGYSVAISGQQLIVGAPNHYNGMTIPGAAYVFIFSAGQWIEQQSLAASDSETGDRFGNSVSISGNSVVVGAFYDGIGQSQRQGSAYLFFRSGATWSQQSKLTASDGSAEDNFGSSVAISGNNILIGAPFAAVNSTQDVGAAYVFRLFSGSWQPESFSGPSAGEEGDHFGNSVAISGDTAVVGVPSDDVGASEDQGSAYVFLRTGTNWTQQAQLLSSDGVFGDGFGYAVGIDGDTIMVGTGFAGGAGVYVFTRSGQIWSQQQKILPSVPSGRFGRSLALSGGTAVIGAPTSDVGKGAAFAFIFASGSWVEQQRITVVDGDPAFGHEFGHSVAISGETIAIGAWKHTQNGDHDIAGGAMYIFIRSGSLWTFQQKLAPPSNTPNPSAGFNCGSSVAISGETAAMGCPGNDVAFPYSRLGSVTVYVRSGASWSQQWDFTPSDPENYLNFGSSVAIEGDTLVVGAPNRDEGGVSRIYIYRRISTMWTELLRSTGSGSSNGRFGTSSAISGQSVIGGAPSFRQGEGSAHIFVGQSDVWNEQQKLIRLGGDPGSGFGSSVAISGDLAVIGAPDEDVSADVDRGAAYVFRRSGSNWAQVCRMSASDGAPGDKFGGSVAISGDTVAIGAPFDDVSMNNDQGSAYVFRVLPANCNEEAHLTSAGGQAGDQFGISVAIAGDQVIVGSHLNAIGANTAQGSAHIFLRSGMSWFEQQQLLASDGSAFDRFGISVSLSPDGTNAIVGAWFDDVGGNTTQGSAYRFFLSGGVWSELQKLTASDGEAGDHFGYSVSISNNAAIVGAFGDDSGPNIDIGSAYVFSGSGSSWTEQAKLVPGAQGDGGDQYGTSVSISSDDLAVVGMPLDDVSPGVDTGAAFVYGRTGSTWTIQTALFPASSESGTKFGQAVAISGDKVLVGLPFSDVSGLRPSGSTVKQVASNSSNLQPIVDQGAMQLFVNVPLGPTASHVQVAGRALAPNGAGVPNAIVRLTDVNGNSRQVSTSSMGYFRFSDIQAGQTYIVAVAAKRFVFSTRSITITDELTDLELIAESQ